MEAVKTLSHLGAHLVNRLQHENRKSIPKFLSGKKLKKKILDPPDLKLYPSKLTNKIFFHMV